MNKRKRNGRRKPAETVDQLTQRLTREHGSAQVMVWISRGTAKGYIGAALVNFVKACARNGWYDL